MELIKDTHITIMVKDMDKSIAFYKSISFTIKNRWGNHYAELTAPGISLGIHPADPSVKIIGSGNISIGFTTEDFAATKTLLESLSIAVTERNEEGGQFLHFNDPDGTELYFIKPKW